MLSTMILHPAGSCPKNAIISEFSGNISITKSFAVFYNLNTPRALEMFTWYLRYVHIEQAPITITPPRHSEAQDWRGDM
jgi:hypothetical protein